MSLVENGVIPLYYELACDCTFPVDEGLTCALMSSWNNLFAFVFYMFWFSPYLAANTEWMTWTCVGACALAVPMLHFMKEHYYRLDIDTHIIEE
ncbi:DIRC2 [Bugula neritina]|uniref:DIRC2 n=1 Tax=Bugula neritina TaxID=10212 RepID=A0A7J7JS70_BUGNE|nr:DIRC2 [Bugula neritina]